MPYHTSQQRTFLCRYACSSQEILHLDLNEECSFACGRAGIVAFACFR